MGESTQSNAQGEGLLGRDERRLPDERPALEGNGNGDVLARSLRRRDGVANGCPEDSHGQPHREEPEGGPSNPPYPRRAPSKEAGNHEGCHAGDPGDAGVGEDEGNELKGDDSPHDADRPMGSSCPHPAHGEREGDDEQEPEPVGVPLGPVDEDSAGPPKPLEDGDQGGASSG